jgi:hypothetical protein
MCLKDFGGSHPPSDQQSGLAGTRRLLVALAHEVAGLLLQRLSPFDPRTGSL